MATEACSVITPEVILGLIKGLTERLCGKNAVRWVRYIHRMFRNEDPWVRRRHLAQMERHSTHTDFYATVTAAGVVASETFKRVRLPMQTSECRHERTPCDIVQVRLGDLLGPEHMATFDYCQLVSFAQKEYGLETCDTDTVLRAVLVLAEQGAKFGVGCVPTLRYVICGHPGDYSEEADSVPTFRIGPRGLETDMALACWILARRKGNLLEGRVVFGEGSVLHIGPDTILVMALPR
jgi:hypothetical protein